MKSLAQIVRKAPLQMFGGLIIAVAGVTFARREQHRYASLSAELARTSATARAAAMEPERIEGVLDATNYAGALLELGRNLRVTLSDSLAGALSLEPVGDSVEIGRLRRAGMRVQLRAPETDVLTFLGEVVVGHSVLAIERLRLEGDGGSRESEAIVKLDAVIWGWYLHEDGK